MMVDGKKSVFKEGVIGFNKRHNKINKIGFNKNFRIWGGTTFMELFTQGIQDKGLKQYSGAFTK